MVPLQNLNWYLNAHLVKLDLTALRLELARPQVYVMQDIFANAQQVKVTAHQAQARLVLQTMLSEMSVQKVPIANKALLTSIFAKAANTMMKRAKRPSLTVKIALLENTALVNKVKHGPVIVIQDIIVFKNHQLRPSILLLQANSLPLIELQTHWEHVNKAHTITYGMWI